MVLLQCLAVSLLFSLYVWKGVRLKKCKSAKVTVKDGWKKTYHVWRQCLFVSHQNGHIKDKVAILERGSRWLIKLNGTAVKTFRQSPLKAFHPFALSEEVWIRVFQWLKSKSEKLPFLSIQKTCFLSECKGYPIHNMKYQQQQQKRQTQWI